MASHKARAFFSSPGLLQTVPRGLARVKVLQHASVPRSRVKTAALPSVQVAGALAQLLTLGYEALVPPCSYLNCGDLEHLRSLDPVLRLEGRDFNPVDVALMAAAVVYLFVKPGVLPGAFDFYIRAPLQRLTAKVYDKEDFLKGKKLGSGGFGTVYLAELVDPETQTRRRVVMKRAVEFGEAECWMNERMMRAAPWATAEFITAFSDGAGKAGDPLWLVSGYEGDSTLEDLLSRKDYPACMETLLFGRQMRIPKGPERRAAVIRVVVQQLLECLQACHNAGIVHRDVKPANMIFSQAAGRVKLIDFGAAADMRIGINYHPSQYLLDPRYAPPEKYMLDKYTARAPPKPLAALLSPVLWNLFHPDRFDMYSVGITLLQMACPNLRSDAALSAFRKQLAKKYNHDLRRWREAHEGSREWAEGFATLDCEGGAGWDLACSLIRYNPRERLSCSAALAHRWFTPAPLTGLASSVSGLTRQGSMLGSGSVVGREARWLEERLACAYDGMHVAGGFSESQLADEELAGEGSEGEEGSSQERLPASATLSWWQGRQSDLKAKLSQRAAQGSGPRSRGRKAGSGEQAKGKDSGGNGRRRFSLKDLVGAGH